MLYRRHPTTVLKSHWYIRHMEAMTVEGLRSKSEIAQELAWRDEKIEKYEPFQKLADEWQKRNRILEEEVAYLQKRVEELLNQGDK